MKRQKAVSAIIEELNYFVQYPLRPETTADEVTCYAVEEIARCQRRAALLSALISEAKYQEQPDYPARKIGGQSD